jgi:hypothetical protein
MYLEIFGGLVSSLMDGGLAGARAGAGAAPDKFAKFNEALAEVERLHRMARLDPGEEEMRDRLRNEVEKMVLPTYRWVRVVELGRADHFGQEHGGPEWRCAVEDTGPDCRGGVGQAGRSLCMTAGPHRRWQLT